MGPGRETEQPADGGSPQASGHAPMSAAEVLESISDAFYAVDHAWRFTYVNRVAEAWWGRSRDDLLGKHYWTEFPQAVGSAPYHAHLEAASERKVVRLEAVSPIIGHWVDISIFPSPHGLSVYFRDISERKQEEARQKLLVNELNHRVKNTLATVQAIAAQSFKGRDVPPAARRAFMDRLVALAKANDLVVDQEWRCAGLLELVTQVVSPHTPAGEASPFIIAGPEIELKPKAASSLALALHELATNAAKYGALATPSGVIRLKWDLVGDGPGAALRITWSEAGGARVQAPTASGFGTRLLREGLRMDLRAEVHIDYAPTGLVCTITAPLSSLAA